MPTQCACCQAALAVILVTISTLAALASVGVVRIPLPAPAHGHHVSQVPAGVYDWQPRPLEGKLALNERLTQAVRLFEGKVYGSESVAVGLEGELVMLDRNNHVYEATPNGDGGWTLNSQPVAKLGAGRPLGYHFTREGSLIVCDSLKGLLKYEYYDFNKDITLLATHVSQSSPIDPGSEITYANDLAIASDGTVYFTSCTDIVPALNRLGFYDTFRAWFLGLMQGSPKGRLLKYDPKTKETHVIAKGFYYANGVALSADESYVVLAETDMIRAHKVWVNGPKAGKVELLIDRLPGVPDGVDASSDGGFWISLVAPAPPFKSALLSSRLLANPLVRGLHAWLPAQLRPGLNLGPAAVLKVDGNGEVIDFLTDPTGQSVSTVSAVSEHDVPDGEGGTRKLLFLGNLVGNYVSYVELGAAAELPSTGDGAASAAEKEL